MIARLLDDVARRAAASGTRDAPGRRLWPALAQPPVRPLPLKGLDGVAARFRGAVGRRRVLRSERSRAFQILDAAQALSSRSEGSLDAAIREARGCVIASRHDPNAIDRAYAVIVEVIRREAGITLHPEQVMGAIVMACGRCAEMATGEGKTITAVLPAAIDGWIGRGVHVHTVNDYLADRDAGITRACYRRLGLRVGVVRDASDNAARREAYACDVTYGADKQFIFDYLRDRLITPLRPRLVGAVLEDLLADSAATWTERTVQRGLYSAIVDEADSVLIDEAVTPAIIGQDVPPAGDHERHYRIAAEIARECLAETDYVVDRRLHRVRLTDAGRAKLAEQAASLPPFWSGPNRREELLVQALTAKELYRRDEEYVVQNGKIEIVDLATGRVLSGRQWQLGIHQAVEAKEGLALSDERRTAARISYQRFFQRYRRLCGMSGTVWEVAPELWRDYALGVVRIPTHRPVLRKHVPDRVYCTHGAKLDAIVGRIIELHDSKRPVLVGTRTVSASEELADRLAQKGIVCRVLNANREAEEAAIVAEAGVEGAVTVATNMAGRGTDIVLTQGSRILGGLVVLATERNDERRVDRQLYGRSGRQGDPGRAESYVSLQDRLIVQCGWKPLVWVCRIAPSAMRGYLTRHLLLRQAQWAASRKLAVRRSESAKQDAWIDVALHEESR
ncbi:MAG: hypothetical protein KF866_02880 [Phycisphaeraceae bacterium]|nr:hypothetical protein [Phycisphaeraceae bacterium]